MDADLLNFIELKVPLPDSSDDKVKLLVNAKDEREESTTLVQVRGELEDYAYVPPGVASFTVKILSANQVVDKVEEATAKDAVVLSYY